MEGRVQYLDILRALACTLVVLTHCVPPLTISETSNIYAAISFFCASSPEIFFIISGVLLLPVCLPTKEFLKKRFMRILPPLLFWSCVIVFYRYFSDSASFEETWSTLLSIPIKPVMGVYWFFYVILGLYLFAPIISKWFANASKKGIHFYLILWGITLTLTSLSIFFDNNLVSINGSYYYVLSSFGGFLGYMILGSYLHNYNTKRTLKNNIIIPMTIIFSLSLFAFVGSRMQIVTSELFLNNLSIVTALMAYAIFMLFKNLEVNNKLIVRIITELSLCSYGIYLIHIFIARGIVWTFLEKSDLINCHSLVTISISLILSLSISYGVVKLIKLLPYNKYIVG